MTDNYKSTDKTQIAEHFNVAEFRCKCGGTHDTMFTSFTGLLEE